MKLKTNKQEQKPHRQQQKTEQKPHWRPAPQIFALHDLEYAHKLNHGAGKRTQEMQD